MEFHASYFSFCEVYTPTPSLSFEKIPSCCLAKLPFARANLAASLVDHDLLNGILLFTMIKKAPIELLLLGPTGDLNIANEMNKGGGPSDLTSRWFSRAVL